MPGRWRRWWVWMWVAKGLPPPDCNARGNRNTNGYLLWNVQVSTFALFCKEMKLKTSGLFFSEKIRELFSYSEWTPEAPVYSIHLSWDRNQWFLCSLIHWLGYQVKDFAPFQEKDLKMTFHSAGEGPGHQILSWMIRTGETERGMLPSCLLAQRFHTLSWVKFSKTNIFAQKASVLINCHFSSNTKPQFTENLLATWI